MTYSRRGGTVSSWLTKVNACGVERPVTMPICSIVTVGLSPPLCTQRRPGGKNVHPRPIALRYLLRRYLSAEILISGGETEARWQQKQHGCSAWGGHAARECPAAAAAAAAEQVAWVVSSARCCACPDAGSCWRW